VKKLIFKRLHDTSCHFDAESQKIAEHSAARLRQYGSPRQKKKAEQEQMERLIIDVRFNDIYLRIYYYRATLDTGNYTTTDRSQPPKYPRASL
jgi:hypothetical protein